MITEQADMLAGITEQAEVIVLEDNVQEAVERYKEKGKESARADVLADTERRK